MANKRMFSKTIIDSDAFLDMPLSTQSLYFHLAMRADDEGFVNNPKKIMRMIGSQDDEIKVLIGKKFIIAFESGVIVIKHWKLHNYIAKDRFHETNYTKEKAMLSLKDNDVYKMNTKCIQDVDSDKISLDKIRIDKIREKQLIPSKSEISKLFSDKTFSYASEKNIVINSKKLDIEIDKFCLHYLEKWKNAKKKFNVKSCISKWVVGNILRMELKDWETNTEKAMIFKTEKEYISDIRKKGLENLSKKQWTIDVKNMIYDIVNRDNDKMDKILQTYKLRENQLFNQDDPVNYFISLFAIIS